MGHAASNVGSAKCGSKMVTKSNFIFHKKRDEWGIFRHPNDWLMTWKPSKCLSQWPWKHLIGKAGRWVTHRYGCCLGLMCRWRGVGLHDGGDKCSVNMLEGERLLPNFYPALELIICANVNVVFHPQQCDTQVSMCVHVFWLFATLCIEKVDGKCVCLDNDKMTIFAFPTQQSRCLIHPPFHWHAQHVCQW